MARSTILRVINSTNDTILANKAVRITGFQVVDDTPLNSIALASNDSEDTMPAVGVTQDDLSPGEVGSVRVHGLIGGFNTLSQSVNDKVYVGTNGDLTYTDPSTSGGLSQQIGLIARYHFTNGQIMILPLEIQNLHAESHYEGERDEIDHGNLAGLGDDTHTQYILVNGIRAFTGTVSGITPTLADHLATKEYVDSVHAETTRPFGEMYISSSSATNIPTAGTYVKIAGTTTLGDSQDFTMPTNNRLQYNGTEDITVFLHATVTCTFASGSNKVGRFRFAKNGTTISKTQADNLFATASNTRTIPVAGTTTLSSGQYIEVWATSSANSSNLTATLMNVVVRTI